MNIRVVHVIVLVLTDVREVDVKSCWATGELRGRGWPDLIWPPTRSRETGRRPKRFHGLMVLVTSHGGQFGPRQALDSRAESRTHCC